MSEGKKAEITKVEVAPVVQAQPFDVGQELARVDERLTYLDKVADKALARTTAKDWQDFGGNAWLQYSGGSKLTALFAVEFRDIVVSLVLRGGVPLEAPKGNDWKSLSEFVRFAQQHEKEIVGFEVMGLVRSCNVFRVINGRDPELDEGWTQVIGGRSALDEWFTKQQQTDVLDIRKAAVTNWKGRAVQEILGLAGYSMADLRSRGLGKQAEGAGKVAFRNGAQGGRAARPEGPKDEAHRKEIRELLYGIYPGPEECQDKLEELTAFTGKDGTEVPGVRETTRLSGKRLDVTLSKVRAWHKAQTAQMANGTEPQTEDPGDDSERVQAEREAAADVANVNSTEGF